MHTHIYIQPKFVFRNVEKLVYNPFSIKSQTEFHFQRVSLFTTVLELSESTAIISDITTEIGLLTSQFWKLWKPVTEMNSSTLTN